MIWLTWRQSRLELIMALILIAVLAALFVPIGLQNLALFKELGLVNMNSSMADYRTLSNQFLNSYHSLNAIVTTTNFMPMLIGILFAIPILIEIEQRTFRLAWTQSVTRRRWLATKLGFALIATVGFSGALTILTSWFLSPIESINSPFNDFSINGLMPVAYAIFALSVVLIVGVLSRRTAPSLIVAIVICAAAMIAVGSGLRPHYLAPLEQINPLPTRVEGNPQVKSRGSPDRAWVIDVYSVDASGNKLKAMILIQGHVSTNPAGVAEITKYQPVNRYWPFQGIEASIFLILAIVLMVCTTWVVTHRMK